MALIAHWPLDGRLGDVSGNEYQLTNMGCEVFNDPEKGLCYKKNIIANGIISQTIASMRVIDNFTVSLWFKAIEFGNYDNPISIGTGSVTSSSKHIRVEKEADKRLYVHPNLTPSSNIVDFPLNSWIHICLVKNNTQVLTYINGIKIYDVTRETINNEINVSENSFVVNILKRDRTSMSQGVSVALIKDVRLFDSILTTNDINKIMKEPYIDLDFKGSIPPTVNWLDNVNKILNNGVVNIVSPNIIRAVKVSQYADSPSFKIPFRKFTVSFKLKVLDGVLKNIGGHAKYNGSASLESSMCRILIDDILYPRSWVESIELPVYKTKGEEISVKLSVDLPTDPIWESSAGLYIQPNRGNSATIEYELYDVQIEEGLIATPFCTWSRDYMQIPDKSSYRDSIDSTVKTNLPEIYTDKQTNLGSSWGLNFKEKNLIVLKDLKPIPIFTLSLVYKPIETGTSFNMYLFNIRPINSAIEHSDRLSLFHGDNVLKLMLGRFVIELATVAVGTTYMINVIKSDGVIKAYVNGKLVSSINVDIGINLDYPISIGTTNTTPSNSKFTISDFKMYPYVFTDEEVANEYKKLKNRVKSMSSAFSNIPTLNVEVPRLWENNPNTIGIDCFSNNPNIPETQAIPIGWGGAFKQPDTSILSVGTTTDMLVTNPEEVIYIDPFLDSVPLHTLLIEDTQTNTESNLTLIKKSKF